MGMCPRSAPDGSRARVRTDEMHPRRHCTLGTDPTKHNSDSETRCRFLGVRGWVRKGQTGLSSFSKLAELSLELSWPLGAGGCLASEHQAGTVALTCQAGPEFTGVAHSGHSWHPTMW